MKRFVNCFLTIALILSLCACGPNTDTSWQEQYDLGVRYLSEGNYEQAVIAFTSAIEIDPKRPEAYADLARAYIAMGETEQAVLILEHGAEVVGESEILDRIWEDLGLDSLQGAEQIPSDSSNEMSFVNMTIEELISVFPTLVQGEIVRSEQGELMRINELTEYSQFKEYDNKDRLVRETAHNADGTVYYIENVYYDADSNQLRISNSDTTEWYKVVSAQGRLLLDYRVQKDASGREGDFSHFTYRYSENQVHILLNEYWTPDRRWTAEAVYTMASSENNIEVLSWGRSNDDVNFDVLELGPDATYVAQNTITVKGTFY